jgi:hypothetical protein
MSKDSSGEHQADSAQKTTSGGGKVRQRIETQIHRRKKARPIPPLQTEWNIDSPTPPGLRMPEDRIGPARKPERPPS